MQLMSLVPRRCFSITVMLVILINCVFMAINTELPYSESVRLSFLAFSL